MKGAVAYAAWMLVILAGASVLRLVKLDNRPMHCDEAVHAIKFGQLLEARTYVYDPDEYHGPSLNYLTWPIARLASASELTEVTEVHLRLVPALSGILLVGLVWLVRQQLGLAAASFAALLLAISPAMVFYSRYYVQEMLLVCATFGAMVALWRFSSRDETVEANKADGDEARIRRRRTFVWPVVFGVCVAWMHVSKETCVIALFALAVAASLTLSPLRRMGAKRLVVPGFIAFLVAVSLSALLFSTFLRNPRGIIDSYATYAHYLGQAAGDGSAGRHVYPWHYYLRVLCWWPSGDAPVWTEAPIAVLALIGMIAGAMGRAVAASHLPYVRFLSIYTIVMIAVYAAIPYKTPWCALGFWHGVILLAGVGAASLVRLSSGYLLRGLTAVLLIAAVGHLTWQTYRASFSSCADPGNPYVYAHTTRDVSRLARQIEKIASKHPDGRNMHVQVLCPDDDYWPLPWYLRGLPRTAWFRGMPQGTPAPVIVTQRSMVPALTKYLYRDQPPGQRHLYVPFPSHRDDGQWRLRPHVPLDLYVRRDLRESYQSNSGSPELP